MNGTIGILGCGWLGLPLAASFVLDGYRVHGSTTSEKKLDVLRKEGIEPFMVRLSEIGIEGPIAEFLNETEILILNVPPKLRGENQEDYTQKMQQLHKAVQTSRIRKVVFISSTSVYGKVDGEVTEKTVPVPSTDNAKQLLASENLFRNGLDVQSTIVRFGGLIGPGRHPVTHLSGKKGISNGNEPVNLIHLEDCIHIIKSIVKNDWWNETFNGVYPHHPKKKEYYATEALKRALQIPEYTDESRSSQNGKTIHPSNLLNEKKYLFKKSIIG